MCHHAAAAIAAATHQVKYLPVFEKDQVLKLEMFDQDFMPNLKDGLKVGGLLLWCWMQQCAAAATVAAAAAAHTSSCQHAQIEKFEQHSNVPVAGVGT
jgi:hypothetical protein